MNMTTNRASDSAGSIGDRTADDENPWDTLGASVETVFEHYAPDVPRGLQRKLRQLIVGLWAVSRNLPRAKALADLTIEFHSGMVVAGPAANDAVVWGLLRRFTLQSKYTCHDCGRSGNTRPQLGFRSLCPRCAAPRVLRAQLFELSEAIHDLAKEDRPIEISEIPLTLRQSFRQSALRSSSHLESTGLVMGTRAFVEWGRQVEGWRRDAHTGHEGR